MKQNQRKPISKAAMPTDKTLKQRRWQTWFAVLFALTSFVLIAVASFIVWQKMGDIGLGLHGWIALVAGTVGVVVLGGGLMVLSFYSARSGHDEVVWQDRDDLN